MTTTEELITYSNSRSGLGIRILGAKRASNKSGIFIKQILDDGLADLNGRLKVGDQILSINEQTAIGISREHAINILRSAAATNQVRLRVRHYFPATSSIEYQKYLQDEKSADEELDTGQQKNFNQTQLNSSNPYEKTTINEFNVRRSSRRHRGSNDDQQKRYTTYQHPIQTDQDEQHERQVQHQDIKQGIIEPLLNSKFRLVDLIDLLKQTYPKHFSNDQRKELKFIEQLTETHPDERITLKDFERQSSVLLGERVSLLSHFLSSSNESLPSNSEQKIAELRRELAACQTKIQDLQGKILTCEKSQRLAQEVELEYEDLLKFLHEQVNQLKTNETNQLKHLRANDQLIQKLFNQLLTYVTEPNQEQMLAQLKFEYEQQNKYLTSYQPNSNNKSKYSSTNKY